MNQIEKWVWTGNAIPSKKNNKNIITLKKRGGKPRPIIVSSAEYLKWEVEFVNDIRKLKPIEKWKSAIFTISSPDLRVFDLTNKIESIMDGMVEAKYITDDSWKYCSDIRIKYGGKTENKEWKVEAEIELE